MSKKVLAISSSFRKGSNSEALSDAFLKGAAEAGYDTEKVCLGDKNIGFCRGCLACLKTGRCAFNDDAVEIAEKMLKADVLVFATPVYYYSVSGQLKTMLDRANPLYGQDYAFRRVYLLTSAGESADSAQEGAIKAVQGWVDCFGKAKLAGTVFAGGVNAVGDIKGHNALIHAYEMGKAL